VISSSSRAWSQPWMRSRANSSRVAHSGRPPFFSSRLDLRRSARLMLPWRCPPSCRFSRHGFVSRKVYTAFPLFPHLLIIALIHRTAPLRPHAPPG
jgi:hypothetical protein